MTDLTFPAMGCDVRLIGTGLDRARAWLEDYEARLSRFRPDSELSRLNDDPRPDVPASGLLRHAVGAALWAARRSSGLVDPTLGDAIVRAGYTRSLDRCENQGPVPSFSRAPARASGRWRQVAVTERGIRRPPGVVLDTGGTGKGVAADHLARMIGGTADCGGDIRVVGSREIGVLHPFTGEVCQVLRIRDGAVATSGIDRRRWETDEGPAHHLLDPSTGRPAWTGIVSATALAPTALEAEALAKAALLSGDRARLTHGGVVVRDGGDVEVVRP